MRIIPVLLLTVLLVMGYFFLAHNTTREISPAAFLPRDTLVYAEQLDGMHALDQLRTSRLGRTVASIDFVKVFREIGTDPAILRQLKATISRLKMLEKNKLVAELLGKRFVLALVAPRKWSRHFISWPHYLREHLLLISKPRVNAAALDMLSSYYSGKVKMTFVPYGKYTIKRIHLPHRTISAAVSDGYILASLQERVLREALDTRDGETGGNLAATPVYHRFSARLAGADRFIYCSIDGLRHLAQTAPSPLGMASVSLESLRGFSTAAYGAWRDETLSWDRLLVALDKSKMAPPIRKILSITPVKNSTLQFAGADTLLYYWTNTMNFPDLWEMYREQAGPADKPSLARLRQKVIDLTGGHGPKEIAQLLGNGVCLVLRRSDRAQFVHLPDVAVLIKLKNPKEVGAILEHVRRQLGITVQSRRYHRIEYHSWGVYSRENLQPVYAVSGKYLILANTMDIFKKIIDSSQGKKELVDSVAFAALDPGFHKANNSVCYIDQAAMADTLQELASWAGTLIAIQDRRTAAKSKILIDQLINPLLSGLAMYDKMATRTYVEDNRMIIESHTEIDD